MFVQVSEVEIVLFEDCCTFWLEKFFFLFYTFNIQFTKTQHAKDKGCLLSMFRDIVLFCVLFTHWRIPGNS